MTGAHADLGPYADLVEVARRQGPLFPETVPDREQIRAVLRFTTGDETPEDIRTGRRFTADGVQGEELSWSVGFGPRTEALFLKPAGATGPLPGIVALYDHGHFKRFGKEKIADGPDGPPDAVRPFRATYYGGRAFANALARRGFAVIVHDTFLWGSRAFPLAAMPEGDRALGKLAGPPLGHGAIDPAVVDYHGAAFLHEHQMAKYLDLLGTSLGAVTAFEDRVALACLKGRPEVDPNRVGAIGFSGGGFRAAALAATADGLGASAIAGMMSTYEPMLSHHIVPHTWMMFPHGLSAIGDFPDVAAAARPAPLLVQYALGDALFPEAGMRAADARIADAYRQAGARAAYRGDLLDGPHRFDVPMQEAAFAWLGDQLVRPAG